MVCARARVPGRFALLLKVAAAGRCETVSRAVGYVGVLVLLLGYLVVYAFLPQGLWRVATWGCSLVRGAWSLCIPACGLCRQVDGYVGVLVSALEHLFVYAFTPHEVLVTLRLNGYGLGPHVRCGIMATGYGYAMATGNWYLVTAGGLASPSGSWVPGVRATRVACDVYSPPGYAYISGFPGDGLYCLVVVFGALAPTRMMKGSQFCSRGRPRLQIVIGAVLLG